MDQYDEDVTQNQFFQAIQNRFAKLFEEVTNQRYVICVPRAGSLVNFDISKDDVENHILLPIDGKATVFRTFNKKEVNIKSGILTTGAGFEETRTVHILFEETFFNDNDESYRVLCTSHPLEGGEVGSDEATIDRLVPLVSFHTLEECAEMLWGSTGNTKMQKYLDDLMNLFLKNLNKLETAPLRHLVDATRKFYNKAIDIVLKDQILKKNSRSNPTFMDNLKVATETYIIHGVYKKLFKTICTCMAAKDTHLNKITRNLTQELQLRDLGVRIDFCQNVPRARKEIASLNRYTTPLGKLACLKRVVSALTRKTGSLESIPLTTDDLLPILVFLVVKADMPHWCANFVYMSSFRFSGSNKDDEYGFYLATLEAAIEHVSSGQLCDIELSCDVSKPFQLSVNGKNDGAWSKSSETEPNSVEKLFRYVKDDNRDAINELLGNPRRGTPSPHTSSPHSPGSAYCHPLCTCERCSQIQAQRSRKHSSPVTIHSRDDKGWTVLHISAYYGHILMTDVLLQKGAVVNACDYHGTTPLHLACQHGHQAVALLLLHYNAGVNLHDTNGNTALHLATLNGHEDCVKALVYSDQGSGLLDLDAANDFGETATHFAAKWGYLAIIELLIENGARVLIRSRKNRLPVHHAHNWRVQHLLTETAEKEVQNRVETVAKVSLRRHSTPASSRPTILPSSDPIRPTIVHQSNKPAERRKSTGKSRPGASHEIRPPTATEKKLEKLLKAIADGDIHMTKLHLGWLDESDDDQDDVDLSQKPLCHPLCQCEKCQPVQKFTSATEQGIHLNIANRAGRTPLHVAALHGHEALVELFLKRGAEVDARNLSHESTPLHLASKQDNMKVVELLVNHSAEVNSRDSQGNTPLHYAAVNGSLEKALFLLQRGAVVNTANKRGNTPLHEAVKWNFKHLVGPLLQHGADGKVLNRQNLTPADLSQSDEITQLLKRSGVRRSMSTSSHTSGTTAASSKLAHGSNTIESINSAERGNCEQDDSLKQVLDSIDDFDAHRRMKRSETIDGVESDACAVAGNPGQRRHIPRSKTLDIAESKNLWDESESGRAGVDAEKAISLSAGGESNCSISPRVRGERTGGNYDYGLSECSPPSGRNDAGLEQSERESDDGVVGMPNSAARASYSRVERDVPETTECENGANYIFTPPSPPVGESDYPQGNGDIPETDNLLRQTPLAGEQNQTDLPANTEAGKLQEKQTTNSHSRQMTDTRSTASASGTEKYLVEKPYHNGPSTDKRSSEAESDLDSEDSTTESQKDLLMEEKMAS